MRSDPFYPCLAIAPSLKETVANLQSEAKQLQNWHSAFVTVMQAKPARERFIFASICGF
jgi:hypothetical protein